jgi:hypothetical protein
VPVVGDAFDVLARKSPQHASVAGLAGARRTGQSSLRDPTSPTSERGALLSIFSLPTKCEPAQSDIVQKYIGRGWANPRRFCAGLRARVRTLTTEDDEISSHTYSKAKASALHQTGASSLTL